MGRQCFAAPFLYLGCSSDQWARTCYETDAKDRSCKCPCNLEYLLQASLVPLQLLGDARDERPPILVADQ